MVFLYDPIIYIIININNGYFIRHVHIICASIFLLVPYLHSTRSIWIRLKVIYIKFITFMIIVSGYLPFILTMIEGFLGYLLCWGQMPYRGITVMINPIAVLPCRGIIIAELIWSAGWVILNRIFVYHFLIGILIGLVILIHIVLLHSWKYHISFYLYLSDFFNLSIMLFYIYFISYLLFYIVFSFIPLLLFFIKFFFIIIVIYQFMSFILTLIIFLSFIYYYIFILYFLFISSIDNKLVQL